MKGLKNTEERQTYLEGLGDEYERLQNSPEVFIDQRDYRIYPIVTIGDQVWLGENLAYDSGEGTYIYDDDDNNLYKYGRLYTWEAAMRACPQCWELPSIEDLTTLAENAGGYYNGVTNKEYGDEVKGYRALSNHANNSFQILLGGYRNTQEQCLGIGSAGCLGSASAGSGTSKWHMWFEYEESVEIEEMSPNLAFSVRCIKKLD
ncbi:MAG: hypothetical protein GY810_02655 [Aureispira sp.]|nr:hypothetical protein [Aureispira sp.]